MPNRPKIAVVLSGCGVYDGSEIHEAVLTMLALVRQGADYQCFAPNVAQADVIDHLTGKQMNERRNVLVESARIARGKVRDLASFRAADFDAVVFPGGFGAAKNLSTFAADGAECRVQPDVAEAVKSMRMASKPVGAMCIAPAVMAKLFGPVEVTIGSDVGTASAITQMGARHRNATHGEVVVDRPAKLATTPCYMLDARIDQIADGTDSLVRAVLEMVHQPVNG